MRDLNLTERVVLFSRFLRNRGFKVFSSGIVDALRGLEAVDIAKREDFFSVLRANLVTTDLEWRIFRELFNEFWQGIFEEREKEKGEECKEDLSGQNEDRVVENEIDAPTSGKADIDGPRKREYLEGSTYSPVAVLEKRDLSQFERSDIQTAQLILKNMMAPFKITAARRVKRSRKPGDIHFRLMMKKSMKANGIPMELLYRMRKKRLKRLVILADVSGSMDRYAQFVMPFIMGIKGIGSRAEVYVFSTSLTAISPILRKFNVEKVLELIANEVPDWSGGTRIGESLQEFVERYGQRHLNKRTVILIMSDGWDLGARKLLIREMETISSKVHCVIWLNPLAGDPAYKLWRYASCASLCGLFLARREPAEPEEGWQDAHNGRGWKVKLLVRHHGAFWRRRMKRLFLNNPDSRGRHKGEEVLFESLLLRHLTKVESSHTPDQIIHFHLLNEEFFWIDQEVNVMGIGPGRTGSELKGEPFFIFSD
jgi:uncharacterized protein with von Willebrand factor type A (vWA) domain